MIFCLYLFSSSALIVFFIINYHVPNCSVFIFYVFFQPFSLSKRCFTFKNWNVFLLAVVFFLCLCFAQYSFCFSFKTRYSFGWFAGLLGFKYPGKNVFFWLCMFSANHTLMGRALVDATQSVVLVANASTSWGAIAAN